jgi:hypothetical protein
VRQLSRRAAIPSQSISTNAVAQPFWDDLAAGHERATRLTRLDGALGVAAPCPNCKRELTGSLDARPIVSMCACGTNVEIDPKTAIPTWLTV